MKHITSQAISEMEMRYRVKFVNSLPGFKSLNLIGTKSQAGETNLSIVSTVTHMGSNPPLIGFISRPPSVDRHTLSNITETGCYTINQVASSFYKQAHQTSARYPREVSEFEAVDLASVTREGLPAPFVEQALVSSHLRLVETIEIKTNATVLVIGEVTDVFVAENLLEADGNLDLETAGTVCGSGLDGYYRPDKIARLSYAKTDRQVSELP